jgi:hypothetical protein
MQTETTQEKLYEDGYNFAGMIGCEGNTYLKKKVDLMHQLGFYDVTDDTFAGCTTETEIDRKARSIMFS